MNRNAELQYIVGFIEECEDPDNDIVMQQLRSLWTAHCIHHRLDVDTAEYDSDFVMVWNAIAKNSNSTYHRRIGYGFPVSQVFENFMCKYLV